MIKLTQPKHREIREWLTAEAEDNERTLEGQCVFLLKKAYQAHQRQDRATVVEEKGLMPRIKA